MDIRLGGPWNSLTSASIKVRRALTSDAVCFQSDGYQAFYCPPRGRKRNAQNVADLFLEDQASSFSRAENHGAHVDPKKRITV